MIKKPKKILIIRLSAIGDTVHGLPVANAIKETYPDSEIHWVVEKASSCLLIDNPIINKVIIFNKKELKENPLSLKSLKILAELKSELQSEHYDAVIDLQGLLKSGIIAFLTNSEIKIGFKNTREFADIFYNHKINAGKIFDPDKHIIDKNMKLLKPLDITQHTIKFSLPAVSEDAKSQTEKLLNNLNPDLPTICLIPFTLWPSKHWIESYWQELTDYFQKKSNIIVTGTNQDNEKVSGIIPSVSTSNIINLTGKTSLTDLITVFSKSDIVIGTDTGPLHIASALNKPIITGIFGSTSPLRTGAYGGINISSGVKCQPCNKKICPNKGNLYMDCMKSLTPAKVIAIIEKNIEKQKNKNSC